MEETEILFQPIDEYFKNQDKICTEEVFNALSPYGKEKHTIGERCWTCFVQKSSEYHYILSGTESHVRESLNKIKIDLVELKGNIIPVFLEME